MKLINIIIILSFCMGFSNPSKTKIAPTTKDPSCTVDVTLTHLSCTTQGNSSNDGSIKVVATSTDTNITWSGNTASTLIPNQWEQHGLMAGEYTIEVFHKGTSVYKEKHILKAPENFEATIEKTDNQCYQAKEGRISITAIGGTPPYLYSIDNGQSYQSSPEFNQLPRNKYAVIIKDANNCMITEDVEISQGAYFSIHHPENLIVTDCLNQKEIDQAFKEWLSGFNHKGGTKPFKEQFSHDPIPGPCGGSIVVTYTAIDDCGVQKSCEATFSVPQKAALKLTTPAEDLTIGCTEDTQSIIQQWLSNNGNANISTNCSLVWTNDYTDQLSDNSCENSKSITVNFTASDGCKNLQTSAVITIKDEIAPRLSGTPQNITVSCQSIPEAKKLTATDNCDSEVEVVFKQTKSTNDCQPTVTRVWTATDCAGNTTKHTQIITVEDTEAPTFVETLPEDLNIGCQTIPQAAVLTATDYCDSDVVVAFEETNSTTDCQTTTIRTWTATDCAGNTTKHSQIIKKTQDEQPPQLAVASEGYQRDVTVSCGEIPQVPKLKFTDNCTGELSTVFSENSTAVQQDGSYRITRVWKVSDPCKNQASFTQTIYVSQDEIQSEFKQLMLCQQDVAYDLSSLFPMESTTDGQWSLSEDDPYLRGSFFDPATAKLGTYTAQFISDNSCTPQAIVTITIHDDCVVLPCDSSDSIAISKAITPNGDAYNEYFTVSGLESCGFKLELSIFNRWGNKIFESMDYQNNWNAFSTSGSSHFVPAGTYYYILTVVDSGYAPIKGYVYVGTTAK